MIGNLNYRHCQRGSRGHKLGQLRILLQLYQLYFIAAATVAFAFDHAAFGAPVFLFGTQLHRSLTVHAIVRAHRKPGAQSHVNA